MERTSKPDLTALLTALSLSSGAMVSPAVPVLAETGAKSPTGNLRVAEKKTTSHRMRGKGREAEGRCADCCGCKYSKGRKMHGKTTGKVNGANKTSDKIQAKPDDTAGSAH